METKALPRILPFTIFMAFIGAEGLARYLMGKGLFNIQSSDIGLLYPVKVLVVTCILICFWKNYTEIQWEDLTDIKNNLLSVFSGLLIFILWINLDLTFATQGTPSGYNPKQFEATSLRLFMVAVRLTGAVLLVPIMEELFWRSFLIRYVISSNFSKTPIGMFTWPSFLVTSVLFGLEHHYILAGIAAGIIFNLLLYYTKSISQCIFSHTVANLALGIYVLQTGQWRFW